MNSEDQNAIRLWFLDQRDKIACQVLRGWLRFARLLGDRQRGKEARGRREVEVFWCELCFATDYLMATAFTSLKVVWPSKTF
jgi:hypothetical protein